MNTESMISVYIAPVTNVKNQKKYSWQGLYDLLTGEPEPISDNLSATKAKHGAYFVRGNIETGYRDDNHLGSCCLLILDVDKPVDGFPLPTPEEINQSINDLVHCVHSTATAERSRIIFHVPPYQKEDTDNLTLKIYQFCRSRGLNFAYAGESKTKSQPWFLPQTTDFEAHQAYGQVNGTMFDCSMVEGFGHEEQSLKSQASLPELPLDNSDHNPMRDFISALKSGTIHQEAKTFAGWRLKTSDLSTGQIFDELDALIEANCSDSEKVKRWFAGERADLEKWFIKQLADEKTDDDEQEEKRSGAKLVIETVLKNAVLKHDPDDTAFAIINISGIRQVLALGSKQFKSWLGHLVYKENGIVVNKNTLSDVLNTLAGLAVFEGDEIDIHVRTASVDGHYYLDLCSDDWNILEITVGTWRVTESLPNVYFRRTSTMRALPLPTNCSYSELPELLGKHINLNEDDIRLLIAYWIECLMPDTEYPILEITGPPGSGKSTIQEMIREGIDPNKVNLRAAPKTTEDVFVSAANNHLVSYNNLSKISLGMSDALCSLSTGGGYAGRKFYTNSEEEAVDIQKPVCLNGIVTLAKQPDLIDRLIRMSLQPISSLQNKAKKQVMDDFNSDLPKILGSLLDAFCKVLLVLPSIKLDRLPRMADFAKLCTALTQVYDWNTDLLDIYYQNRAVSFEETLETSPAIMAVVEHVKTHGTYEGTVGKLYGMLELVRTNNWVKSARGLSEKLRIHTPALKAVGISIFFDPVKHNDGRHLVIKTVGNTQSLPSRPSRPEEKHDCSVCRDCSNPTVLGIDEKNTDNPEPYNQLANGQVEGEI